jgi:hypothetical protein
VDPSTRLNPDEAQGRNLQGAHLALKTTGLQLERHHIEASARKGRLHLIDASPTACLRKL